MTGWLLDTNVLSELRRPKPERKVLAFVGGQPLDLLYVSAVTLAELRFGIELVAEPGRRAELNDWLGLKVRPMFEQRVLPVSEDIMFKWRPLVKYGRKTGHTFSQPDRIVAATALHHGLTVVTRDVSDYQKARAPVRREDRTCRTVNDELSRHFDWVARHAVNIWFGCHHRIDLRIKIPTEINIVEAVTLTEPSGEPIAIA